MFFVLCKAISSVSIAGWIQSYIFGIRARWGPGLSVEVYSTAALSGRDSVTRFPASWWIAAGTSLQSVCWRRRSLKRYYFFCLLVCFVFFSLIMLLYSLSGIGLRVQKKGNGEMPLASVQNRSLHGSREVRINNGKDILATSEANWCMQIRNKPWTCQLFAGHDIRSKDA